MRVLKVPANASTDAKPVRGRFVIHEHHASRLHFDLRLEIGGTGKSWAVPKGPSMDPAVKRLAVPVEDHSIAYGGFEGLVGMGGGSGAVIVWDRGTWAPLDGSLDDGHLSFTLEGEKLRGGFALTRWDDRKWLFVKKVDDAAVRGGDIVAERPESVLPGRTWEELVP